MSKYEEIEDNISKVKSKVYKEVTESYQLIAKIKQEIKEIKETS